MNIDIKNRIETTGNQVEINDGEDDENELCDEEVSDEVFYKLFEEAFFFDEEIPPESQDDNKGAKLVRWICLFLSCWEYSFNITDSALEFVLKFLKLFFQVFQPTDDIVLDTFCNTFPGTLYSFHKCLSFENSYFKKYVVCIKCCTLYDIEQCTVNDRGEKESKKCSFIKCPNHLLKQYRKQCCQLLMKSVKSPSGKSILLPLKTYCYRSLKKSLELLLSRDGFEIDCEKWRNLEKDSEVLADVYDGNIWKTFSSNGKWYFEDKRNVAVMLNVDWFQPFRHVSSFSVDGISLVILDLLRTESFKRKNAIFVGIIPNMKKEPPTNNFPKPMFHELNEACDIGKICSY